MLVLPAVHNRIKQEDIIISHQRKLTQMPPMFSGQNNFKQSSMPINNNQFLPEWTTNSGGGNIYDDDNFKRKNTEQMSNMYRQFQEQSTVNMEEQSILGERATGFHGSTANNNMDKISNIFSDRNSMTNIHLRNFSRDSCPAGMMNNNLGVAQQPIYNKERDKLST